MKQIYIYLVVFFLSLGANAQIDSVFYYNSDGTQNWWHLQKDMFVFRCSNGGVFGGNCSPLNC